MTKSFPAHTSAEVLARLDRLRRADAPTHGGGVLSYVYDAGRAELAELVTDVAARALPLNGLDPTTFTSVATFERELVDFVRTALHGPEVVGSVTAGGTESCILAVKAARDRAGVRPGTGSIVVPSTAHPAFLKAGELLGVSVLQVPVPLSSTAVDPDALAAAVTADTFLLVASAPNYPTGALDPIAKLGAVALELRLPLHVDACLGGLVLPWWPEPLPAWDFSVPGVSSVSADLHKFGYAPKGVSVLLHRDRDRHRAQYFATTRWPGYPVVNPTLLGSKSAVGTAAAWALVQRLGTAGFSELAAEVATAAASLRATIAGLDGLTVVGSPTGPLLAVTADPQAAAPLHPHLWARAVARNGFTLQLQPRYVQGDGSVLPASAHLTVTPVTLQRLEELNAALTAGAAEARLLPAPTPPPALAELSAAITAGTVPLEPLLELPSAEVEAALRAAGVIAAAPPEPADRQDGAQPDGAQPDGAQDPPPLDLVPLLAAIEALPPALARKLLTEFLSVFTAPPTP